MNSPYNVHFDPDFQFSHTKRRWKLTCDFVSRHLDKQESKNKSVLAVGGNTKFDYLLAREFGLRYYWTEGDLDRAYEWNGIIHYPPDVIFIFEVIEHLQNPLDLLEKISKWYCEPDTLIFLSTPLRPCFLQTDHHFKEYDRKRLLHLFESAGLEVVDSFEARLYRRPWYRFFGVRPILRLLFDKVQMYCLRVGNE